MTLSYAYRCDICGELVTLPIDRADPQTPPDGWGSLTMHYPGPGPSHQRKHTCPTCTAALRSDEAVNIYRIRTAMRDQPFLTIDSTEVVPLSHTSGRDSLPDAPSGLDPRDLECHRCGRTYHVDNYDPESPSGELCLDCYRELLKKRDEAEKEGRA